jgi:plastocyanin
VAIKVYSDYPTQLSGLDSCLSLLSTLHVGKMHFLSYILSLSYAISSLAAIIKVNVGEHGSTFSPDSVNAAMGDEVEYHFLAGDRHSVAEGSFGAPCTPVADGTGYWSGVIEATSGEAVSLETKSAHLVDDW